MGTLGTTLVIQGSRGTPNGYIGVQVFICIDFRMPLGSLLGPLWRHFSDLLLIWSVKMGDGFQVHIFSDPGMEMMPGCRGGMCYNHNKNMCFSDISLFPRIHEFSVSREGFRCHFGDFW